MPKRSKNVLSLEKLPFTIDCLPFGVVTGRRSNFPPRCAIAIGDHVLDLMRYFDLELRQDWPTTRRWEEIRTLASSYRVNLHRIFSQVRLR